MSRKNARTAEGTTLPTSNGEEHEFCPTPADCALSLIHLLPVSKSDVVYDAGAGRGAWCKALWQAHGVRAHAVEMNAEHLDALRSPANHTERVIHANFLRMPSRAWEAAPPTLVIGNPPFTLAEAFVRRSLLILPPGGRVAMLLRHAFALTAERDALRLEHPHFAKYDLATRPSFYQRVKEDGTKVSGTDGTDYAWFVWIKGWRGRPISRTVSWGMRNTLSNERTLRDRQIVISEDWPLYPETR